MVQRKTGLSQFEMKSQETKLKMQGYQKAFGTSELMLKPKEYVINEDLGSFNIEKKFTIAWNGN